MPQAFAPRPEDLCAPARLSGAPGRPAQVETGRSAPRPTLASHQPSPADRRDAPTEPLVDRRARPRPRAGAFNPHSRPPRSPRVRSSGTFVRLPAPETLHEAAGPLWRGSAGKAVTTL